MAYEFHTTPERSQLMSKIRGKNTIAECMLSKALWEKGVRYRRNYRKLPGTPDIAITKYKIAVSVDSEFWHGYNWEEKKSRINSNKDYWIKKIERNTARDQKNTDDLVALGWEVIRFWEHDVKKNLGGCIGQIHNKINGRVKKG